MDVTEDNAQEQEKPAATEKNVESEPLFVLPSEEAFVEESEAAMDNAAPIEDLPETNFEFSTFNVKSQKQSVREKPPTESVAETMRKTGLAWSAAIVFFGSVVFMMILGWFADLLMDSSPWGVVVGIILGSIIGFIQFFRITSQIINPMRSDFEKTSIKVEESPEKTESNQTENDNSPVI